MTTRISLCFVTSVSPQLCFSFFYVATSTQNTNHQYSHIYWYNYSSMKGIVRAKNDCWRRSSLFCFCESSQRHKQNHRMTLKRKKKTHHFLSEVYDEAKARPVAVLQLPLNTNFQTLTLIYCKLQLLLWLVEKTPESASITAICVSWYNRQTVHHVLLWLLIWKQKYRVVNSK